MGIWLASRRVRKLQGDLKDQAAQGTGRTFEEELFRFICDNRDAVIQFATPDEDKVSEEVESRDSQIERAPSRDCPHSEGGGVRLYLANGKRMPFYADRLHEVDGKLVTAEPLSDIWDDVVPNDLHNEGGSILKKGKKPEKLLFASSIFARRRKSDLVVTPL